MDCQSCGACCQALPSYQLDGYVLVFDEDVHRMTQNQVDEYVMNVSRPAPLGSGLRAITMKNRRCAALEGEIGSYVSCKIYDNRPNICRAFEIGSNECMLAREEVGLGEFCHG